MAKIIIGKSGGKLVKIDLRTLLKTRALIQAGSGGGKSYLLRRLAEQIFGKVQTLIIDRDGEFASLREKYGFVLAGEDGDTATDVRSARLLAERLLELQASAVCDLYEAFRTKPGNRRAWVRGFLEGIMDAPKKLWRPLVVIVDEAHLFCPQESPKAASMIEREIISGCKDAMVALATAGRKRGFCSIWATQRLAKLDKDASAELLNRFVGNTIEDVDVDRAADLMSVSRDEKAEFKKSIKNLDPGDFYGFGRAVSKDRILIRIGPVKTTHPESGSAKYAAKPPPAPGKILHLLPKLKDLPKAVETKAKNEGELQKEIQTLNAKIKSMEKAGPAVKVAKPFAPVTTTVKKVEIPIWKPRDLARLEKAMAHADSAAGKIQNEVPHLRGFADQIRETLKKFEQVKRGLNTAPPPPTSRMQDLKAGRTPQKPARKESRSAPHAGNGAPLDKPECAILKVLAHAEDNGCMIGKIALLAGYRVSGGFKNSLSSLRTKEYMVGLNTAVMRITTAGLDALGDDNQPLPEGDELAQYWLTHQSFGTCERKILKELVDAPDGFEIDELAKATGYAVSGGFKNSLSSLRTAGVLVGRNTEVMKPSEALMG